MVKIFAVILAIIGLCVGVNVTFFQTRGFAETTAVILDLTEEGSGDDTTYRPTVEYEVDGETYIVKLDNSVKADSVGNTITVLYDPSNPELAYGKNGMGIYLLIVCPLILAFVLISIFKGKRRKAGEQGTSGIKWIHRLCSACCGRGKRTIFPYRSWHPQGGSPN